MAGCVRRVLPVINRCVIFDTTDDSYHGHPEPLSCPEGWTRKSLALYYFSNGRPAAELSEPHSTIYRRRPGERLALRLASRSVLKRLVPPIFVDLWHYFL